MCTSPNVKSGYYASIAACPIYFILLKAAGRAYLSTEEVSHLLEKLTDSWAPYFQSEKGTTAVRSDTFDLTAQPRVREVEETSVEFLSQYFQCAY